MRSLRNKILSYLIASALSLSAISCNTLIEPNFTFGIDTFNPLSITWNKDNSIVCFGTSITNGKPTDNGIITIVPPPPPPPDSSYPKLLNDELKIKVANKGYWGGKIDFAKTIFIDSVLTQSPVLILLEFGANEFLQGVDVQVTERKLDSLIVLIKSFQIQIVLLSFYNPDMLNQLSPTHFLAAKSEFANKYYEMFVRVAKKNKILLDDYILRSIWGIPENMSTDGLHPNNKGNAVLKDNILYSLHSTFLDNGMLK